MTLWHADLVAMPAVICRNVSTHIKFLCVLQPKSYISRNNTAFLLFPVCPVGESAGTQRDQIFSPHIREKQADKGIK